MPIKTINYILTIFTLLSHIFLVAGSAYLVASRKRREKPFSSFEDAWNDTGVSRRPYRDRDQSLLF